MLNIRPDTLNVKQIPYHIAIRRQSLGNLSSSLMHRRHYGYVPRESTYVVSFLSGDSNILVVADIRNRLHGCDTRPWGPSGFSPPGGRGNDKGKVLGLAISPWRPRLDVAKERRRSVRDRFRLPFREASDAGV